MDLPSPSWRRRLRLAVCAAIMFAAACADAPTAGPAVVHLESLGGDEQTGEAGLLLGVPLEVRVVDEGGAPIARVRVRWETTDGGALEPAVSTTDASGRASARWRLGLARAAQAATAHLDGGDVVTFRATVVVKPVEVPRPLTPITLRTFDGSGEVVHPDHALASSAFPTGPAFLVVTPYPNGNATFERPSLFAGGSADVPWIEPAGIRNPLVDARRGYLSDPDLVYDPAAGELRLYYREVDRANVILMTRSRDAVAWTDAVEVVQAPNHDLVSPAVVRRSERSWFMWSVNSGSAGCGASSTTVELRTSSDGLRWSKPRTVQLEQSGVSAWHIDVAWVESAGEYWAVFNGKVAGSCTTPALWLATSRDGVRWTTYPSAVLVRGSLPAFQDIVYRSTFEYDPGLDAVTFWYSGARHDAGRWIWSAATERMSRADLFARVTTRSKNALAVSENSSAPPLLVAP